MPAKTKVETAKHMEYEFEVVQRWIDELEEIFSNYVEGKAKEEIWRRPSREEWRLSHKRE
jgi:hypothetical protein